MEVKLLEVRDRMTMLPVMATLAAPANEGQRYLLGRVGFMGGSAVILTRLLILIIGVIVQCKPRIFTSTGIFMIWWMVKWWMWNLF